MNRKKINKLISSTISVIYLANSSPVFALDSQAKEDTLLSEETSNIENNDITTIEPNIEEIEDNEIYMDNENITDEINDTENTEEAEDTKPEDLKNYANNEEIITDVSNPSIEIDTINTDNNQKNINQKSTEVYFEDINLLKAINKALSKGDVDTPVTIDEMATLSSLNISRLNITSLVGLEHAINLNVLTAQNNLITDLTPISNLTSLTQLDLQGNPKFSLEQFNKLGNLKNLISLIIAIDAPESTLNIGPNALFPNIQQLNISTSSINSLIITDANSLSYLVSDNCTIQNVSINNSNASSISFQKSIFNNITIENCSKLSSISASSIEFENLYIGDCSSFAYIALTSSKPNNMTFKNVPLTAGISLYNTSMNDLILENISSGCTITTSGCSVNNIKINDSKVGTLDTSGSTVQNIELTNLSNLTYLTARTATVISLLIDNCPNIRSIVASSAKLPNIDFSTLTLLSSLDLGGVEMDTVDIVNLTNLSSVNLMNAKINNLHLDNLNAISMLGLIGSTFENISISNMNNLKSLGINNIATTSLSVKNCDNLTSLDGIPKIINNLKLLELNALTSLNISNCSLEELNITNCSKLDTINASSNNITLLDGFLIPSITNLNLNNNKIKDISKLKNLTSLQTLSLDNNNISDISHLKEITSLSASNISALNQTASLPDCYSIPGDIVLKDISIIDYDGNIVPVTQVPSGGSIINDSVILGNYTEGLYDENIELSSNQIKYSVLASQKLIVDGTAPTLKITPNINSYTKDNIILTVEAEDELTGLDYIKLPNGTIIKDSIFELEATKNGDYEFEAVDLVGNVSKQTISISNIDTEAPTLKVTPNTTDYTKNNVLLTVEAEDILAGLDYIKLPNGDIINESTFEFEVTKNGDYEFEAVDLVGNISKQVITVSNIDNEAPTLSTTLTYNDNYTEAILKIEATDLLSGVSNITLPDGQIIDTNTTSFKITKNGDYKIVVTDLVGNSYSEIITVDKIKDIPVSDDNTNDDNDTSTDKPIDDSTNDNNSKNENDNSNSENNSDKLPNSSGFGVFAPIVAMISLAIGALSFKKKK